MNAGMMWFDNDPLTALTSKVNRAADYYRKKYGLDPDICMVHPSMLEEQHEIDERPTGEVAIRSNRAILPGHFWIGTEEKT